MPNSATALETFTRFREIDMTPSEKKVAEYIIENRDEIIHMSITELAQKSDCSESTIVRLCKKLHLRGYQEFRLALAQDLVSPVKQIHEEVDLSDTVPNIQRKVFQTAIQALTDTETVLAVDNLEKAVTEIQKANSISFFGIGASGVIALDAFYRFSKLGIPCHVATDGHSQSHKAILLKNHDVVVAVSHSGRTYDIISALDVAKKQGATIIAITQFGHTPITEVADIVLFTSSRETAFRTEAMASRIVQSAILDSIFVGVALSRYEEVIRNYEKSREVAEMMRIDHIREIQVKGGKSKKL